VRRKKTKRQSLAHNYIFAKCWPIFTITNDQFIINLLSVT